MINIKSIVSACKLHNHNFKEIHILNGGKNHNEDDATEGDKLLNNLIEELKKEYNNCNIILLDNNADYDFIYLTKAPYLVIAGGSFAIWGTIGNMNGKILSPCCKNLNFPKIGKISPELITNNWNTYDYDY